MEQKKLWYALLCDEEDNDWGTGTFDRAEAIEKMNSSDGYYTQIAVIDANYDGNGNATSDGVCIEEIRAAEAHPYEAHPYIVVNNTLTQSGSLSDCDSKDFDDLDEAIAEAESIWAHLTTKEKKMSEVYVLESINPDVDAPNHYDGSPVYYPKTIAEKVRTREYSGELIICILTNHDDPGVEYYYISLDDYTDEATFTENVDAEMDDIEYRLQSLEIEASEELIGKIRYEIEYFFESHNCGYMSSESACTMASNLYDDGWRAEDKDEIKEEYHMEDENTEKVIKWLRKFEAEEIAEEIKESDKWDMELCAQLAELADMSEEYAAADGETFEGIIFAAAEKLGVEVI